MIERQVKCLKIIINLFSTYLHALRLLNTLTKLNCLALVRHLHCLVVSALHQHHKGIGLIPAG